MNGLVLLFSSRDGAIEVELHRQTCRWAEQELQSSAVAIALVPVTAVGVDVLEVAFLLVDERGGAIRQHVADQCVGMRAAGLERLRFTPPSSSKLPSGVKLGARLVYLMAPSEVFLPSSVPCGPRRISTRSRSVKS